MCLHRRISWNGDYDVRGGPLPPHFHVRHGDLKAEIDIRTGELRDGMLPRKKLKKIEEWRTLHMEELLKNWEIVTGKGSPNKVDPL